MVLIGLNADSFDFLVRIGHFGGGDELKRWGPQTQRSGHYLTTDDDPKMG